VTTKARPRHVLPSITRIADFDEADLESGAVATAPLDRAEWATGQYVEAVVAGDAARPYRIERRDGRRADVLPGDRLIGALGRRAATLQAVGDWKDALDDGVLDLLSMAGVIGRCTSRSQFGDPVPPLTYLGHVRRDDTPVTMREFAVEAESTNLAIPVVLIIGTSMDAGKTLTGTRLVRLLRANGARIVAAKLTGVGRYRDVQALGDAGADWIFDFVDAGLPSTAVPRNDFCAAVGGLLGTMGSVGADVAVVEAGASPLEPYNGDTAVDLLGDCIRTVVLCASDPYAAAGVMQAFPMRPSIIAGRAASTTAGVELTERLTGRPCLDLLDGADRAAAEAVLLEELGPW